MENLSQFEGILQNRVVVEADKAELHEQGEHGEAQLKAQLVHVDQQLVRVIIDNHCVTGSCNLNGRNWLEKKNK